MSPNKNSLRRISALLIVAAIIAGCDSDSLKNPVEPSAAIQNQMSKVPADGGRARGDRLVESEIPGSSVGCTTASGVIPVGEAYTLYNLGSIVWFPAESVTSPTVVYFDICDQQNTGTGFSPKIQIFGSDPNFSYFKAVRVDLSLEDAGLSSSTPTFTPFSIYRQTAAGDWVLHSTNKVLGNGIVRYWIVRNGMYVVSLDSTHASLTDTSWTVSGDVDPVTGGTLDLLNSSLSVPSGAVNILTNLTFTITAARPQGLPNSFERVFEFGPHGTVFQVPITLDVAFSDGGISRTLFPIKLYYFDESTGTWVPEREAQIDWWNERMVVQLNHFSRYAFAR